MGTKILVVGEVSCDGSRLKRMLGKLRPGDYEIRFTSDGTVALGVMTGSDPSVAGFRPDIVLLDIDARGVNGLEFLGIMRSHFAFFAVKTLVVTENPDDYDVPAARQLGVSGYLSKPLNTRSTASKDIKLLVRTLSEV